MQAFSPRIEPDTSTMSTTARRLRIRSRTMMSVSSGTGCSVEHLEGAVEVDVVGSVAVRDADELTRAPRAESVAVLRPNAEPAGDRFGHLPHRERLGRRSSRISSRTRRSPASVVAAHPCARAPGGACADPTVRSEPVRSIARRSRSHRSAGRGCGRSSSAFGRRRNGLNRCTRRSTPRARQSDGIGRSTILPPSPARRARSKKWSSHSSRITSSGVALAGLVETNAGGERDERGVEHQLGASSPSSCPRMAASESATATMSMAPRTLLPCRTSGWSRVARVMATASATSAASCAARCGARRSVRPRRRTGIRWRAGTVGRRSLR